MPCFDFFVDAYKPVRKFLLNKSIGKGESLPTARKKTLATDCANDKALSNNSSASSVFGCDNGAAGLRQGRFSLLQAKSIKVEFFV